MSAERSITSQQKQLEQLPAEFKRLAEWGWCTLRPALETACMAFGMDAIASARSAARVARLCVTQIYGDVKEYRRYGRAPWTKAFVALLVLLAPAIAVAQTQATRSHGLGWQQSTGTLAEAQAAEYFLLDNGTRITQPMLPIACTGTAAPFACRTPFPQLTPGPHTLTLVMRQRINGVTEESPPSAPLAIVMVIVLSPTNLVVLPPTPPDQQE